MSSRRSQQGLGDLLSAMIRAQSAQSDGPAEQFDESSRTLELELARGLAQINAQAVAQPLEADESPFSQESIQFARDLIQFTYERAKVLGLSPRQFRNTFGLQSDLQSEFEYALQDNRAAVQS